MSTEPELIYVLCPDNKHKETFNKVLITLLKDGLAKSSLNSHYIVTSRTAIYFPFEEENIFSSLIGNGMHFDNDGVRAIKFVRKKEGALLV